MDLVIILVALGLAMDSFSVSITRGLDNTPSTIRALKTAFFFGLFQAVMLIIGWIIGSSVIDYISGFDHWIAFLLLAFIGTRMIYEAKNSESKRLVKSSSILVLLMLSVATSIDALAVGLSLSFLEVLIIVPALLVGIVTFLLSFFGVYVGNRFRTFFGRRIEIIGGLILILIGVNIVVEHSGV